MFKRFVISGTKQDDILTGSDRLDIMFGKKGNDVLDGRGGNDFLFGGKGNDELSGGEGNDKLFGGKGDDQLFGGEGNDFLFGGKGDDFLDGGAGSDRVFGDKGDDSFNYTLSENAGATDFYDGGKGFDTLQLTLTGAEFDAAKAEIDEFNALLADGGGSFSFSFGLNVRSIEELTFNIIEDENAAPVAVDDVIVGAGSAGGTVRVGVIGGAVNFADEVNAWLNEPARGFDFQAVALPMSSDWTTALTGFDVAVIGDDGFLSEYNGAPAMFAALRVFVDSGHGVVSTGWYAGRIGTYDADGTAQINLDSDYVSPAASFGSQKSVPGSSTIVVDASLPVHPITSGVISYQVQGLVHEVAGAVDSSGGLNGNIVVHARVAGTSQPAIISATGVGISGNAHTVFLGSLHMAGNPAYGAADTLSRNPAKILEQAIAWATGEAATDEDTPRVIDVDALLANDTDAEGDAFTFESVANFSLRGAALSVNTDGNIVYDPTGAAQLQELAAGVILEDSFNYTVIDGSGRTDTATVSLKVLGLAEPVAPVAESFSSFEDSLFTVSDQPLTSTTADADTLL